MSAETSVDPNDPMMLAWQTYKKSMSYESNKKWTCKDPHVYAEGSLWASFVQGWTAAKADSIDMPYQGPPDE